MTRGELEQILRAAAGLPIPEARRRRLVEWIRSLEAARAGGRASAPHPRPVRVTPRSVGRHMM